MNSEYIVKAEPEAFRNKIIDFLSQFGNAVMLDSNANQKCPVPVTGITYDFLAGAGVEAEYRSDDLNGLQVFLDSHKRRMACMLRLIQALRRTPHRQI